MSVAETQVAYGFKFGEKKIHKYKEWPVPKPKPGQVLLEVKAAGLCSSDLHILKAQEKHIPEEFIMGHEIAGDIVQIGEGGVPEQYYVGQRVALCISQFCGLCLNCRSGKDNLCEGSPAAYGLNMNGGFQRYVLVKNALGLIPIPDEVSYEDAAVASDAVLTPFHAINGTKEKLNPSSKVLVVGLGGLGLNAVQILKNFGCLIVAIDVKKESGALATDLGAEFYSDLSESFHPLHSFDVCYDFVGIQSTIDLCTDCVKKRGIIAPVGLGSFKLKIKHFILATKEVQLFYSFGGPSSEHAECLKWIADKKIKPITNQVSLDHIAEYFEKLAQGRINGRVVFRPSKL